MSTPSFPVLLQEFKEAYDAMDADKLANLFADSVNFKGTGDEEYKQVLREDVAQYFRDFVEKRDSQRVEFDTETLQVNDDGELSINAVFHFVNKGAAEEQQKPIFFKIETQSDHGVNYITDFGSFPRQP